MTDETRKRYRRRRLFDSLIGAGLSAVAAVIASMVANGQAWEVSVPLVFVVILLVISSIFGAHAGILGTITSALVFAAFLFPPLGKFTVAREAARANLAWMLLLGIAFAFLFAPQNSSFDRR